MTELTQEEIAGARRIAQLLVGPTKDLVIGNYRSVVNRRAGYLMAAGWEPAAAFDRALLLGDRVIAEIAHRRLEIAAMRCAPMEAH